MSSIRYVALAALVGCSSSKSSKPSAPVDVEVATFFTPSVTSVLRGSDEQFPIITYLSSMVRSPPECWSRLRATITAGYQLEVPGGSYFLIEGALPRAEVETCVTTALAAMGIEVGRDGELATFELGPAGTAYVAWRGSVVIAGSRQQVMDALAAGTPELARTWHDRLARLPPAPLAMWRQDEMIHNLFGVPTASYQMVIDKIEVDRESDPTATADYAGRVIAEYSSPGDAETVARRIRQGELEPALAAPPDLVEAVKRMKVTQTGMTVEVAFDNATFAGVDLELLQGWLAGLATAQAEPAQ
jgi:hypothetical protein